ncbi:MAG: (d)CMP kinase [Candidatus Omnitrophica bacterium]|nr:(d)CMP kinase [Candidatus Omnitrophota bacterium]
MGLHNNVENNIIVTIDGPAGAGKSTIAKEVSKKLGFTYLDTGAMYRSLTLSALNQGINLEDEDALVALAKQTHIDLCTDENHKLQVLLDGKDVTEDIRSSKVTNNTFHIASVGGVREIMVNRQREIGAASNVVAEGRDIGTVVFPNAKKKFYLDANFQERAQRRIKELREKGKQVEADEIQKDLQQRDTKDFTRKVGPLKKAEDAIVIDSTHMSIEQVVQKIIEVIRQDG